MAILQKHSVVCDDVRIENNGKFFIIGMYTPDIAVSQIPWIAPQLTFLLWLESDRPGNFQFRAKLTHLETGTVLAQAMGGLGFLRPGTALFPMRVQGLGFPLRVHISLVSKSTGTAKSWSQASQCFWSYQRCKQPQECRVRQGCPQLPSRQRKRKGLGLTVGLGRNLRIDVSLRNYRQQGMQMKFADNNMSIGFPPLKNEEQSVIADILSRCPRKSRNPIAPHSALRYQQAGSQLLHRQRNDSLFPQFRFELLRPNHGRTTSLICLPNTHLFYSQLQSC